MKLLISGSRTITDIPSVVKIIENFVEKQVEDPVETIVTGNAKGVDSIANLWAMNQPGIKIINFPAEWDTYGTYAGPRRNLEMVQFCDKAIAIWDGSSKGTGDMIRKAKKAGKLALLHMYR